MFHYFHQGRNICYWIHPSNLVGSAYIRLVVERILQVLHYVVLPAPKGIFVLQPPPGGIRYLRLYMIVLWILLILQRQKGTFIWTIVNGFAVYFILLQL